MPGVPMELAKHSLNVIKGSKPVKQATRRFGDERRKATGKEINRPKAANFIKEVVHTDWVANPVLVPKKNKELRSVLTIPVLTSAAQRIPLRCLE